MVFDLTRADWGARPPNRSYLTLELPDKLGQETHHTVGVYGCSDPGCLARAIQGDHLGRGWTDVFYHALIWFDGTIVELRPAWARTGSLDDLTVVFPGNYSAGDTLTDAQKMAWHKLRDWAMTQGMGSRVRWHRERCGGCSSCPGSNVIQWLIAGYPNPTPPEEESWLDMADKEDVKDAVREVLDEYEIPNAAASGGNMTFPHALRWAVEHARRGRWAAEDAPRLVWHQSATDDDPQFRWVVRAILDRVTEIRDKLRGE